MTTSWTRRTTESTTYTKRTPQPVVYETLITGTFSDNQEYILTDGEGNAIFVYDGSGYPIISTVWTKRSPV